MLLKHNHQSFFTFIVVVLVVNGFRIPFFNIVLVLPPVLLLKLHLLYFNSFLILIIHPFYTHYFNSF